MRVKGWERNLYGWQRGAEGRAFAWGTFDCCIATAEAVQAVTGLDLAAAFRGGYTDEAGALQTIAALTGGAGTVEELAEHFAREHGFAEILPTMATRGDAALVQVQADGPAMLAVFACDPRSVACVAEKNGFFLLPAKYAARAWRIG
jgi:hypothetical protein